MKVLAILITMIILNGCESNNSPINLSWLAPEPVECEECPEPKVCGADGLIDELEDQIDVNNVKMEHYVNEIKVEENYANLIDIDGHVSTKNHIEFPTYSGSPMKHTLIIEFMQIK